MAYIGVSPSNGVRQKHTYTATASQTTFSGAGSEGISLSYRDSNYVDVYRNGVKLGDADYTATSGTSIVLGEGAAVSDIIEIIVYDVFSVADTVSKADGGVFDGNVTMAGTLGVTGETTLSANLNLGDNDKAIFGAGSDLQIYHDSANGNSYIQDAGTGQLRLEADSVAITNTGHTEFVALFNENADVKLYHDGLEKLATTSTGIQVTGNIANASGDFTLDVAGQINLDADSGNMKFRDDGVDIGLFTNDATNFVIRSEVSDKDLIFRGNDGGSFIEAMRIDMSAGGNVGIGTSSPTQKLSIAAPSALVDITSTTGTSFNGLELKNSSGSFYIGQDNSAGTFYGAANARVLYSTGAYPIVFFTNGSNERMRIDSSGLISLAGDTDTGWSLPTANQQQWTCGGALTFKTYQIAGAYGILSVNGSGSATYPNFTFNGDDNTGMFRATTDTLAFTTGGSEAMRIDSSGHLLVSTTTSFNALNGRGDIVAGNGSSNGGMTIYTGSSNQGAITFADGTSGDQAYRGMVEYDHSTDNMAFKTAVSERMRITSGGDLSLTGDSSAGETNLVFTADSNLTKARIQGSKSGASGGNLIFSTNNTSSTLTERMRIDSSGRVTKPYQPHFQVRSNLGNNGNTWEAGQIIKFQTVDANQGSHYSTSTGSFTAPVAGFYQFNFTGFGYNGAAVGTALVAVALRKNGTNYIMLVYNQNSNGTTYPSCTASASVYLSVNDYVQIYVDSTGIYADASNLYTAFSGFLVG